jgi:putative DNA primase/helicase
MAQSIYYNGELVSTLGTQFDADPRLLGCENGILVLNTEPYLRPAKKEDYVTFNTHTLYIPWDLEAANESGVLEGYQLWKEYLDIFLPDIKIRHFIQKVMGHLLIGENPEKLLIFVYGPHDTGKSTMLSGIKAALGDYYGTIDINLFSNQKLNPGLIRAVPLRVAGMSEVDDGKMDASMIKRLTGNDTVTAEAKFSNDIFEGRPQFTTLIACNQEPSIKNVDEALQERIMVLPFDYQIPMDKRDYGKQSDIEKTCSEAVLAWLVQGWKMYCREGLKRAHWPLEIARLCGHVVGNLNPVQQFISECIEKNTPDALRARQAAFERAHKRKRTTPSVADWDTEWTPIAEAVYELYTRWCTSNGEKIISKTELAKEIGVQPAEPRNIKGINHRCYFGIRLKESGE